MGGAERRPSLASASSLVAVLDEPPGEVQQRSLRANAITSLAALLLAVFPFVPAARVTQVVVVGFAWMVFEVATVTFHRLGGEHPLYRVLSLLDELCQIAAVLSLIYLCGTAATPLWLFGLAKAFVWDARSRPRMRATLLVMLGTYGALSAALVAAGRMADAAFAGLALFAATIAHTTSARSAMHAAEMRAERDLLEHQLRDASIQQSRERFAREIHDGIGADVTALLLNLRREARRGGHPDAAALADRAQGVLDELRSVVWSLRNEQGTLAELAKLIDATCRRLAAPRDYVRSMDLAESRTLIGPTAALEALEHARTLVARALALPGVTRVELTLSARDALIVSVHHDAASAPHDALAVSIALDEKADQGVTG